MLEPKSSTKLPKDQAKSTDEGSLKPAQDQTTSKNMLDKSAKKIDNPREGGEQASKDYQPGTATSVKGTNEWRPISDEKREQIREEQLAQKAHLEKYGNICHENCPCPEGVRRRKAQEKQQRNAMSHNK